MYGYIYLTTNLINGKQYVVQLTKDGEFVNEFFGVRDATRKTGINQANISRCCAGNRKSAGGYRWMYKTDYDKIKKGE